jgi:hypothetical protein
MGRVTYKTLNQPRTQGRPSSTALGVRLVTPWMLDGAPPRRWSVAPPASPWRPTAVAGGEEHERRWRVRDAREWEPGERGATAGPHARGLDCVFGAQPARRDVPEAAALRLYHAGSGPERRGLAVTVRPECQPRVSDLATNVEFAAKQPAGPQEA